MLQGQCTPHGAGIRLSGDYYDFQHLYNTIYALTGDDSAHHEFILGFAYEIRKTKSGNREIVTKGSDDEPSTYYSVDILWPEFLTQVAMLRNLAAYQPTTSAIQSDLYRLEACIENALDEADSNITKRVMNWIQEFSVSEDYLTEFIFAQTRIFVFSGATLNSRLKKLPNTLAALYPHTPEYQKFEQTVQTLAKKNDCDPSEFHDLSEWPDFKW